MLNSHSFTIALSHVFLYYDKLTKHFNKVSTKVIYLEKTLLNKDNQFAENAKIINTIRAKAKLYPKDKAKANVDLV